MVNLSNNTFIAGKPLNPSSDPSSGITFKVINYNIMMGQIYPYPHEWYKELAIQGIIDCFGNPDSKLKERLTICFLPYKLTPTKPLTDLQNYGGMIFADFSSISSYLDLLRNYSPVNAHVNQTDPSFNRLFTEYHVNDTSVKNKMTKIVKTRKRR